MRSATLASVGLALWLVATSVLVLVLNVTDNGSGGPSRWAFALRWLLSNGGAFLALLGAYGLARGVRAVLLRRRDMDAAGADHQARRGTALILVIAGLVLNAFAESQSFLIGVGDSLPPVYGVAVLVAAYAAPVALAVGTYLALRRLAALIGSQPLGEGDVIASAETPRRRTG